MTPGLTDTITRDRFRSWAGVLKKETATPILCLAVGHGDRSGSVHVVQAEGISEAELLRFLRFAVAELEKGGAL